MKYCEQDQDRWIREQFDPGFSGYAVDVGANDGVFFSNTAALEESGWIVLCIEANDSYGEVLESRRKLVRMVAVSDHEAEEESFYLNPGCPASYSSLDPSRLEQAKQAAIDRYRATGLVRPIDMIEQIVRVRTVAGLLDEVGFPRLDLLTVDVEGTELDVLRGSALDKWKPRCIIAESWTDGSEITDFLKPLGYALKEKMAFDYCYRLESEVPLR